MNWTAPPLKDKGNILKEIHAIEPHQRFDHGKSIVELLRIPFYPDSLLIRCRNIDWREGDPYLWYVKQRGEKITPLDGSVANIHFLNAHANLQLTEDLIPSYLKFYFFFYPEEGCRRYLIEEHDIDAIEKNDGFVCRCLFLEERVLYQAQLQISLRGEVEILSKKEVQKKEGQKRYLNFSF